ncbi:cation:proton antiporter [Pseudonocardia acaciae]|uniref:cation:proton antiporter domain-containing protein n=1 Tax=Pseudonocardia acaciae TaxID=551276 RepID=UPI0007E8D969|nr:cation:proton antiporter [Pseudonocardia acaciae]
MAVVDVVAAAVVVLAVARVGGALARRLGSDRVVGEIVAGFGLALAIAWLAAPLVSGTVLPEGVMAGLRFVAEAGLAWYLVGITHELRFGLRGPDRSGVGWVAVGSLVPPLCLGAVLGAWPLTQAGPAIRGAAPAPAFVLFVAVALAITAVPVLARVIGDRGMSHTRAGRVALAAAIVNDSAGWLVLSVAVSLNAESPTALLRSLFVLLGGAVVALLLRRLMRVGAPRRPLAVTSIALVALAVSQLTEHLGLTAIFGAVLVGLAIPAGPTSPWQPAVVAVSRAGRGLVPLYFAVTGLSVFATAALAVPWWLIVLVLGCGVVGKVGGGYLGAALGHHGRWDAARIGVLMNTRGLTELVVLQVGYHAAIITGTLFLAFLVMALVTTACTGPALSALDRLHRRRHPAEAVGGGHQAAR